VLTRSRIGAAGCGLMLLVAGCGGGNERLSASGYVRSASAVCARSNRAVVRIAVPPFDAARDASRSLVQVVAVQRTSIDDLRALRPPERFTGMVQRWTALLDQAVDELEEMGEQLRAGQGDLAVEFGAKATTLFDRARELVAPQHMTSCRGPELPTV